MLSQCLNVSWESGDLPSVYGGIGQINKRAQDDSDRSFSHILAVIALRKWDKKSLDGVLNGAIILSVLSASNTALYISSRTLYGMAYRVKNENMLGKAAQYFAKVDSKTGVPLRALFMSWASFIWVPFVSLGSNNKLQVQYVSTPTLRLTCVDCYR